MRKNYKFLPLVLLVFLISQKATCQYGVGFDATRFGLVNSNFAARLVGEATAQSSAKKIKSNLDKVNENYAKLIVAKTIVDDALCNVNSALKNALAVKEVLNTLEEISESAILLVQTGSKYPQYSHLTKVYVENAALQAIALQNDVLNIALKGQEKNIIMNYNYRDQIVRDVYIRLRLINADLQLACRSIKQAASLGFLRGATPFGGWIDKDKQIVEQIINQAKYL
ncbi:MAG: hypothetical protein LBT43_06045 [Prevotella sp.]|jgi:hypothetical protein|nr:hypothetical protein [Prevotella sp.]